MKFGSKCRYPTMGTNCASLVSDLFERLCVVSF